VLNVGASECDDEEANESEGERSGDVLNGDLSRYGAMAYSKAEIEGNRSGLLPWILGARELEME
jgi:hypothetical protein